MIRTLHFLTTLDVGGAESQTLAVLSRLPSDRYRCSVAWLKGAGELAPSYEEAGIAAHRLRSHGPGLLLRALRLVRRERPHIVHTHMMKADFVGGLAARLAGVPVVVSTKHNEDDYLRFPPFAVAARATAELADRVVVISDAVGGFFRRRLLLPEDRFHRIAHGHPGLPQANGAAARARVRAELGLTGENPLVVTVSRLTRQKGLSYLLRAASLVRDAAPDAVFVVAGRGEQREALRDLAARLDLGSSFRFLGLRRDVPDLLAAADLFVLPSLWEGFGLVLLEAMEAGLPIVGTKAGAIPEVVADGETGLLVPPRDPEGLATAILTLLADPERAREMGRAGRTRRGVEFGLAAEVAGHAALYEELLREQRRRA